MTFSAGDRVRLKAGELASAWSLEHGIVYTVDGYDPAAPACIFLREIDATKERRRAWFDWRFDLVSKVERLSYSSDELWNYPI